MAVPCPPDDPLSLYGEELVDAIGLTAVKAIDSRTVALTTAAPTTLLLGAGVPILPEHIWSSVTFADGRADLLDQGRVPGAGQAHGLREDRGRAEPGHAVQGLGPGAERREPEAVGRMVARWHPYAGVVYFHLLLDSLSQAGLVTHHEARQHTAEAR